MDGACRVAKFTTRLRRNAPGQPWARCTNPPWPKPKTAVEFSAAPKPPCRSLAGFREALWLSCRNRQSGALELHRAQRRMGGEIERLPVVAAESNVRGLRL